MISIHAFSAPVAIFHDKMEFFFCCWALVPLSSQHCIGKFPVSVCKWDMTHYHCKGLCAMTLTYLFAWAVGVVWAEGVALAEGVAWAGGVEARQQQGTKKQSQLRKPICKKD